MLILGIDPGTQILGYSLLDTEGGQLNILAMDVLYLKRLPDFNQRIRRIFDSTVRIIDSFHPDHLAIEAPFFGKNVQAMLKLGRAQGAAIAAALHRQIPVFEYEPRKAKMAVTGNGAASKEQVQTVLGKTLHIEMDNRWLDASDALAIAMCHFYQLSNPLSDRAASTSWKAFVDAHPDRIAKPAKK